MHIALKLQLLIMTSLFAKLIRPGDSKGTYRSRVKLPLAKLFTSCGGGFILSFLLLSQAEKLLKPIFIN